jgi:hypothetical protein
LWNSSSLPCSGFNALWPGLTCGAFDSVLTLSLPSQGLMGTLPATWSRLNRLQRMDLSFNSLRGTLPAQWSGISRLTIIVGLNLRANSLNGTLPAAWGNWEDGVESLDLSLNSLSGPLPDAWAGFSGYLKHFAADGNQLGGSLPAAWSVMAALETLSVAGEVGGRWEGGCCTGCFGTLGAV